MYTRNAMPGYIYQPLPYMNGMSCQIVNTSATLELIPNGSPKFLTKSTRNEWEKSKYYTSWIADTNIVDRVNTDTMFAKITQPLQLRNRKKKSKLVSLETQIREKKSADSKQRIHVQKESTTTQWWNGMATELPDQDTLKWWNPLESDAHDSRAGVQNNKEIIRARMRNHLPVPNTILGAFSEGAVLVRLRSVTDSDMFVSADDVSTRNQSTASAAYS
jgi:hypothetical protein